MQEKCSQQTTTWEAYVYTPMESEELKVMNESLQSQDKKIATKVEDFTKRMVSVCECVDKEIC